MVEDRQGVLGEFCGRREESWILAVKNRNTGYLGIVTVTKRSAFQELGVSEELVGWALQVKRHMT